MTDDSRSRVLLNYRLAPDMLPFVPQIQVGEGQLPRYPLRRHRREPHRLRIGGISVASRGHHALQKFPWNRGTR